MKTTIHEATRDDSLRLEAFLKRRFETSMFLRSNLREYGIGNKKDDFAMRYFLREKGGAILGVGAVGNNGTLMMQASEGLTDIAAFMRDALPKGMKFPVLLGAAGQVKIFRAAFGLTDAPTTMDEAEPLFALNLENVRMPKNTDAVLRKTKMSDLPLLADWANAYDLETGLRVAGDNRRTKDVIERIKNNRSRLLMVKGQPVAQTGFNATMPDTVQIGGVYTPPENRGQGFARAAVALHLDEVQKAGVKHAILFSANEYASRAYRSIGFRQIGSYTITLFA
ncbi:MAG: GNAT family N-acetyltransferase [Paracoccaceae bacterium]